MTFNVAEFRSQLVGDGARPNLFRVTLAFPGVAVNASAAAQKTTFMAKTSQLPGSTLGTVPLYYFGRETKWGGNRTFTDWTLQIINDEDFLVRSSIESWMNAINSHAGNLRDPAASNQTGYTVDAKVEQYGKTGNILKSYNFIGLFPVDLAPIDLDWGSNDTVEEYAVTFAYQWWTSDTTS